MSYKHKFTIQDLLKDKALAKSIKDLLSSPKPRDLTHRGKVTKDIKLNKKDTRMPPIPKLDSGDFLETYLFVLSSIFNNNKFNNEFYALCLQQVHNLFSHLVRHHGITQGTAKWKERAQYMVLLAEGRNPEQLPWVATEGSPPVIKDLIHVGELCLFILNREEGHQRAYQALITLLSLPRISKEKPDLNLDSITDPRVGDDVKYKTLIENFRNFVRSSQVLKLEDSPVSLDVIPRMRMTKGPNAEPTLTTSIEEAGALLRDNNLRKSIELYCTHTGNTDFFNYIADISRLTTETEEHGYIGRIVQVPDSLNKNRVVAMVDYWTNVLLAPLEELIRFILKVKFHSNDFLRNHSEGAERVRKSTRKSWSLDLSSWTDRFPIDLQQIVVEKILGHNLGQHWKTILVGRKYWVPSLNKFVTYKVGQPMGSKSSFAVASVTHHMLLRYAYSLARRGSSSIPPVEEAYVIVGDDLVVFDENLSVIVKELYSTLGVSVSLPKSKIPVGEDLITEFCSRTSWNNMDVSRIPPNLIKDASRNWRNFPLLLKELKRRDVQPNMAHIPNYLKKVDKNGSSYLAHLKVVLTLPILGVDLSDLADSIDCKVDIYRPDIMREVVYTKHLLSALGKVDKASDVFSEKLEWGTPEWEVLNSVWDLINNEDVAQRKSMSFCIWNPKGPLYNLAIMPSFVVTKSKFHTELEKAGLPHPASLASVLYSYECARGIFGGLPSLYLEPDNPKDMTVMSWLKEIGKQVAAVLPKEAEDLVPTVGNSGKEFVRTQILHYLEVHKFLSKRKEGSPIDPYPVTPEITLDLNKEESQIDKTKVTFLVKNWGNTPMHTIQAYQYLVDAEPSLAKEATAVPPVVDVPLQAPLVKTKRKGNRNKRKPGRKELGLPKRLEILLDLLEHHKPRSDS